MTSPVTGTAIAEGLIAPRLLARTAEGVVLRGARCRDCGRVSFPAAALCDLCHSLEHEPHDLGRTGSLYSYSVVHVAPRTWKVPYVLAYVDLADGIRVLSHVQAPPSTVAIGMQLVLSIGEVGLDEHGEPLRTYVFRPYELGSEQ